jgi:hypothetical protein
MGPSYGNFMIVPSSLFIFSSFALFLYYMNFFSSTRNVAGSSIVAVSIGKPFASY